ncbi:hypothetical protein N602_29365 [Mycobacterium avium subsp. hominissuis 10-5606]|nr:hypothetical protein N602_29365 [Mycobacterium avium subsp. hominissuis 10-5606]
MHHAEYDVAWSRENDVDFVNDQTATNFKLRK